MAERRQRAPERGPGNKAGLGANERSAARHSGIAGHWLHLQRTVGNRMTGELLRGREQISAAPSAVGVQRAPGLPTKRELRDEGLEPGKKLFGKTAWSKLGDALDAYEKLGDLDFQAQEKQMQRIEAIAGEWQASYDERARKEKTRKKDSAKLAKVEQILAGIRQRRITIEETVNPSVEGREGRRRGMALHDIEPLAFGRRDERQEDERKEEIREKKATFTMNDYLKERGYKADRNYWSWGAGGLAHVSWKAHVGSGDATQRLAIAQTISPLLMDCGISHKFDNKETEGPLDKFLTVYPPKDEAEWQMLVSDLEAAVGGFVTVDVSGDMPVGETGKVHMRHGQNTPLSVGMLIGLDVREEGKVGPFTRYVGDPVHGDGLPLLVAGETMFFSKTMEAPAKLSPEHIYMAILVDGRIVPDRREEPNPANVPLPTGVKRFERK